MLISFIILIQFLYADDFTCPRPELNLVPDQVQDQLASLKIFNAHQCLFEQVSLPENCSCEGQETALSSKAQSDALESYDQDIDDLIESEYIDSYTGRVFQMLEQSISLDVYLKRGELKDEDLIRVNKCRPNSLIDSIKELEKDPVCSGKDYFKKRVAKMIKKQSSNPNLAEFELQDLQKMSIDELSRSAGSTFFNGLDKIARNEPSAPGLCIPYKAYLEISNGSRPMYKEWVSFKSTFVRGRNPKFPFVGGVGRLDTANSEDAFVKDFLTKDVSPDLEADTGISKSSNLSRDPMSILRIVEMQDRKSSEILSTNPLMVVIMNDPELKEEYQNYVDTVSSRAGEDGSSLINAAFLKKVLASQNERCEKILSSQTTLKTLLCMPLPKPSKDLYRSRILPRFYAKRKSFPGGELAFTKYYKDSYCPKSSVSSSRPSRLTQLAPDKKITSSDSDLEQMIDPLSLPMGTLESVVKRRGNVSSYESFNEKMCPIINKCSSSPEGCDNPKSIANALGTDLISSFNEQDRIALSKKLGVELKDLESVVAEVIEKMASSRSDETSNELRAKFNEITSFLRSNDKEKNAQVQKFIGYLQSENRKNIPKESVRRFLNECGTDQKCNKSEYWAKSLTERVLTGMSESQKLAIATKLNVPIEKLSEAYQEKLNEFLTKPYNQSQTNSLKRTEELAFLWDTVKDKDAVLAREMNEFISFKQIENLKNQNKGKDTSVASIDNNFSPIFRIKELISPENENSESRTLFSDYAKNGTQEDQVKLEILAPVLAERDRNPIGVSSPIELPYQRRIEPAPNVEPTTIPVPQNESLPAPKVNELASKERNIERGSKNTSESSSEYVSTAKNTIPVEVDTRPIKTTSQTKPETEPETIKPASTANSDLNDSISRAQKALKDYERLKNQAPKDDPMAQAEVDRLRRELDSARQNIEDTKRAISDVRNSRNRAPSSSYDYGSPFGGASSGSGGARPLADPYDPQSIPTAQASISAPEKEGGITSGSVGKSGGLSSDESLGSVAPKGSLTPSQALSSLQGKGVIGGKQGLLAYMFEDVISHRLLTGSPEDVLNMIKILGLEGMNFKTVEALRDQSGDIKYLVRFFSLESADADGVIKSASSNPLKMCKKPFDDAKGRMKAFEQIQSYREKSQDMFLTLVAKNMCIEKEVMIGYDEYQALASHLLDQEKMRQRVYAIAKFRSKLNGRVKRGIASEAE